MTRYQFHIAHQRPQKPCHPQGPREWAPLSFPVHEAEKSTDLTPAEHTARTFTFRSVEHRAWHAVGVPGVAPLPPAQHVAVWMIQGYFLSKGSAVGGGWVPGMLGLPAPHAAPLPPPGCPRSVSRTMDPMSATWASMTVPRERRWCWHQATSSSTSWVSAGPLAPASQ